MDPPRGPPPRPSGPPPPRPAGAPPPRPSGPPPQANKDGGTGSGSAPPRPAAPPPRPAGAPPPRPAGLPPPKAEAPALVSSPPTRPAAPPPRPAGAPPPRSEGAGLSSPSPSPPPRPAGAPPPRPSGAPPPRPAGAPPPPRGEGGGAAPSPPPRPSGAPPPRPVGAPPPRPDGAPASLPPRPAGPPPAQSSPPPRPSGSPPPRPAGAPPPRPAGIPPSRAEEGASVPPKPAGPPPSQRPGGADADKGGAVLSSSPPQRPSGSPPPRPAGAPPSGGGAPPPRPAGTPPASETGAASAPPRPGGSPPPRPTGVPPPRAEGAITRPPRPAGPPPPRPSGSPPPRPVGAPPPRREVASLPPRPAGSSPTQSEAGDSLQKDGALVPSPPIPAAAKPDQVPAAPSSAPAEPEAARGVPTQEQTAVRDETEKAKAASFGPKDAEPLPPSSASPGSEEKINVAAPSSSAPVVNAPQARAQEEPIAPPQEKAKEPSSDQGPSAPESLSAATAPPPAAVFPTVPAEPTRLPSSPSVAAAAPREAPAIPGAEQKELTADQSGGQAASTSSPALPASTASPIQPASKEQAATTRNEAEKGPLGESGAATAAGPRPLPPGPPPSSADASAPTPASPPSPAAAKAAIKRPLPPGPPPEKTETAKAAAKATVPPRPSKVGPVPARALPKDQELALSSAADGKSAPPSLKKQPPPPPKQPPPPPKQPPPPPKQAPPPPKSPPPPPKQPPPPPKAPPPPPKAPPPPSQPRPSAPSPSPISTLVKRGRFTIICLEGTELGKKGKPSKLSPYVKLTIGKGENALKQKSETIKDAGPSPSFYEQELKFDLHSPMDYVQDNDLTLTIEVWNAAFISDELLGALEISLLRFYDGNFRAEYFELKDPKTEEKAGGISLRIGFQEALIGMLCITTIEGRQLKNQELLGKQDPYCRFEFGKTVKRGSTVQKGGSNPYFKEEEISFWVDSQEWVQDITAAVLDQDIGSDDLIGSAPLSLLEAMQHRGPREVVLKLAKKGKFSGELVLQVEFLPAGKLTVLCVEGKKLRDVDSLGKQDPYLVISTEGATTLTKKRTRTDQRGGTAPRWNESLTFWLVDQFSLKVQAWDEDTIGSDDLIGSAEVSLLSAFKNGVMDSWVKLSHTNRIGTEEYAGEVHLMINFEGPSGIKYPQHQPMMDSFDESQRVNIKRVNRPSTVASDKGRMSILVEEDGQVKEVTTEEETKRKDEEGLGPAKTYQGSAEFTEEEIRQAFAFIDLDRNNFIGAAEIRHILICMGELITDEEIDEMINMVDQDGDGQVSFDEFYRLVIHPDPASPEFSQRNVTAEGETPPPPPGGAPAAQQQDFALKKEKRDLLQRFCSENSLTVERVTKAHVRFMATKPTGYMVDLQTMCDLLLVEPTGETKSLFSLFDRAGSGQIDVREFLLAVNSFTGATKEERAKFAFELFDDDRNGYLTEDELLNILKANHLAASDAQVQAKANLILKQADDSGDGRLDYGEFLAISKKFPNILFPAFQGE